MKVVPSNRTNELKKSLTSLLKTVHSQVYYRRAPTKTGLPYITYYLKHIKIDHSYNYNFEVHIWTKDIKEAEALADTLEEMDSYIFRDHQFQYDLYLESRLNVEDEDKEIQHIVLLFNLTYFDQKG